MNPDPNPRSDYDSFFTFFVEDSCIYRPLGLVLAVLAAHLWIEPTRCSGLHRLTGSDARLHPLICFGCAAVLRPTHREVCSTPVTSAFQAKERDEDRYEEDRNEDRDGISQCNGISLGTPLPIIQFIGVLQEWVPRHIHRSISQVGHSVVDAGQ